MLGLDQDAENKKMNKTDACHPSHLHIINEKEITYLVLILCHLTLQ